MLLMLLEQSACILIVVQFMASATERFGKCYESLLISHCVHCPARKVPGLDGSREAADDGRFS